MSKRKPAYRTMPIVTRGGASERIWLVIRPCGTFLDRTFDDPDAAVPLVEELNRAYELGRKSAGKMPAKGSKP